MYIAPRMQVTLRPMRLGAPLNFIVQNQVCIPARVEGLSGMSTDQTRPPTFLKASGVDVDRPTTRAAAAD